MPVLESKKLYILNTDNTTYAFRVMDNGYLEHLYYGRKIRLSEGAEALFEKHEFAPGNTALYTQDNAGLSMQDVCLEVSAAGKGDMRTPFVEVIHADGSRTSDFTFDSAKIKKGKKESEILPSAYGQNDKVDSLIVTLNDKQYGLELKICYYVFADKDVIVRRAILKNKSDETVRVNKLASAQIDFNDADWRLTTFNGAWTREMRRVDTRLVQGRHVSGSSCGASSNTANPFFMLSRTNTDEDRGEVYSFNLIYSGNHEETAEINEFGKTRIQWGINPAGFEYMLEPGETFETPEAVMTYSDQGFNGMSQNMHRFVRENIVRGEWKNKERPVLLNSWEAAYFNINESRLLKLAKAGKAVGIELFVMDDGWFGERNDDSSSLGDWTPNPKKLPGGIKGIAEKIEAIGLKFGLWVEPEMVNVKSELYRKHPDWTLEIPGRPHSEGRNQRILDLSKTKVQDYLIEALSKVFSSGRVSYVKWDYNRNFTDVFSQGVPAEKQGEVSYRYMVGLYRVMKTLTEKFPHILFEGCASGGNRFDLGILSYFPQIWASDDTDAICRAEIQNGYSYGYPMSVVTAHVSGVPNHQTLRVTPLATRFNVAAFGILGYECNLADMSRDELADVKMQIDLYKRWRSVFFNGDFYRGRSWGSDQYENTVLYGNAGNVMEWNVVSKDKSKAVGMRLQKQAVPNFQYQYFRAKGLDGSRKYKFYNIRARVNIMDFGDLVNTVSPVHIRQGSAAHELIAKFVKVDGEEEKYTCYGDLLMNAGVRLSPAFGGTGLNDKVRQFSDYASRLYFMEED